MQTTSIQSPDEQGVGTAIDLDALFDGVMNVVSDRFNVFVNAQLKKQVEEEWITGRKLVLFSVGTKQLFSKWRAAIAPEHQQYFNCHSCRVWFDNYAGMVEVLEDGSLRSPLFSDLEYVPDFFHDAFRETAKAIESQQITRTIVPLFEHKSQAWESEDTSTLYIGKVPNHDHEHGCHFHGRIESKLDLSDLSFAPYHLFSTHLATLNNRRRSTTRDQMMSAYTLLRYHEDYGEDHAHTLKIKFIIGSIERLFDSNDKKLKNLLLVDIAKRLETHLFTDVVSTFISDIGTIGQTAAFSRFRVNTSTSNYQRTTTAPTATQLDNQRKLFQDLGYTSDSMKLRVMGLADQERFAQIRHFKALEKADEKTDPANEDPFAGIKVHNAKKEDVVDTESFTHLEVTGDVFMRMLNAYPEGTTIQTKPIRISVNHPEGRFVGLNLLAAMVYDSSVVEAGTKLLFQTSEEDETAEQQMFYRPTQLFQGYDIEGGDSDTWFDVVSMRTIPAGSVPHVFVVKGIGVKAEFFKSTGIPLIPSNMKKELIPCARTIQTFMRGQAPEIPEDQCMFMFPTTGLYRVKEPGQKPVQLTITG